MTVVPTSHDTTTDGIDPDTLRSSSDGTASSNNATSATEAISTSLGSAMPSKPSQNTGTGIALRFPLVAIASMGLSATLYSIVPRETGYELAAISRSLNEPWQIGGLLAWKIFEIFVPWTMGLDCAICSILLSRLRADLILQTTTSAAFSSSRKHPTTRSFRSSTRSTGPPSCSALQST